MDLMNLSIIGRKKQLLVNNKRHLLNKYIISYSKKILTLLHRTLIKEIRMDLFERISTKITETNTTTTNTLKTLTTKN